METKIVKVVRGNKEEYYELPRNPGDVLCTSTDYSFATAVKADHPPRAVLLNCPAHLLWATDYEGRPIPHLVGVPKYNPDYDDDDFLDDIINPEQQVVELLDWWGFDPNHEVEKDYACYVRDVLHEQIAEADEEDVKLLEEIRSLIPTFTDDMIGGLFESHVVTTTRTERISPYWDGTQWVDPEEEYEKEVEKRLMPTIEEKAHKRIFMETKYFANKNRVEAALNNKHVFNSIEADMALLQTERDRVITKLNTMDPIMDINKIIPLRAHLYDVQGKIDAIHTDFGLKPLEIREPTWFETAVRKVRGAVAYIGGEVIGKAVNAISTATAPIRHFISGMFQALDASTLGAIGGLAFLGVRAGFNLIRKAHSL